MITRSDLLRHIRAHPLGDFVEPFVPGDPRGIVLGCGFAGLAALGLVGVIDGDPLGYAYLAWALVGGFFLPTRAVPTFVWLLVAGGGLWAVSAGSPAAWVQVAVGLILASVAMLPPADDARLLLAAPALASIELQPKLSQTSTFPEVSRRAAPHGEVMIRTLGHLQILVDGRDLAPSLLDKRILGYLWCSLLAVAVSSPGGAIERAALASELAPGPNRRSQLERLRRQLWDLQHDLPQPLAAMVHADRNQVRLDLGGVDCELVNLRRIADQIRRGDRGASGRVIADVQAALDATGHGRFLPEFEHLARSAHQSRSSTMQVVTEVRTWVLQTRISLAQFLARQSPQSAH